MLYGRGREMQQLQKIFHNTKQVGKAEVILVSGQSGTGKTTLIEKTFEKENCLYGYGKFDRGKVSAPFASLRNCFSGLGEAMLEGNIEKYANLIKSSLSPKDFQILVHLVPELDAILPEYAESSEKSSEIPSKDSFERLKFVLRLFTRTISTPDCPAILFFDDLQWIDEMTLEVLMSITSDPDARHFLLIGAYREEDFNLMHKVASWIEQRNFGTIHIGNLEPLQIQAVLTDFLKTHEDVEELADLFYNRTCGNIFHVMQLIEFLKTSNNPKLLEYSPTRFRYVWDIKDIRMHTSLSDNVVDVIMKKIHKLPGVAQSFLKVASCVGSRFDRRVLEILEIDSLLHCLEVLIEHGLLEQLSENQFQFLHDKIHQAAVGLIPSEERSKMHLEIGKKLFDHFFSAKDEFSSVSDVFLFTCVNQLNIGVGFTNDKNFRWQLAKLNREAVIRAASYSAFLAAIQYAEKGIRLLDQETMWLDNYNFCLDIHTLLVEMCFSCGQVDLLDKYAKEVIDHAKSTDDKLRAYFAALSGKRIETDEDIKKHWEVLKELGESVPKGSKMLKGVVNLMRTHCNVMSMSDDDILALPPMKSVKKAAAVRLTSSLFWMLLQKDMFPDIAVLLGRMMAITLKEGLSEYSPLIFGQYGYMLMFVDSDIKMACRIGSLSILLLDKIKSPPRVRIAVFTLTSYLTNWQQPLSLYLDRRIEAYQESLRLGDLKEAFRVLTLYGMEYFYSGLPLEPLALDMKKFLDQMVQYNQLTCLFINLPLYQAILNLSRHSGDVSHICKNKETIDYRQKYSWDGKTGEESSWSYDMQVSFFYGDMETANDCASKLKHIAHISKTKRNPSYYGHARVFFFALIAIANFRKTGKYKHLREAKKYKSQIQEFVQEGSINLPHKLQILEAELASVNSTSQLSLSNYASMSSPASVMKQKSQKPLLRKDSPSTCSLQTKYEKAIARSKRSGFLQDAALCALLANKAVDVGDGRYSTMAFNLLERWGATTVIKHFQSKQFGLKGKDQSEENTGFGVGSRGYRARSRFTEGIQKEGAELSSFADSIIHTRNLKQVHKELVPINKSS